MVVLLYRGEWAGEARVATGKEYQTRSVPRKGDVRMFTKFLTGGGC